MTNIGIIGFGCVAKGFYELLQKSDLAVEVSRICVKDASKKRNVPNHLLTTDWEMVVYDPSVDIIIELIDDDKVALEIAKSCIEQDLPLISANKKMIAENLAYLVKEINMPFYYEGAVAGAIPVLHNLKHFLNPHDIREVRAILNGSSNYILTEIANGSSFETALAEAQRLGFAESDPTLDISGQDAANKLVILAHVIFDETINVTDVTFDSLQNLSLSDIKTAIDAGKKLKQIASLQIDGELLKARVQTMSLDKNDPLFPIDNEYNAIQLSIDGIGDQIFTGKGAGSLPTGAAVLHDLSCVISDLKNEHRSRLKWKNKVA